MSQPFPTAPFPITSFTATDIYTLEFYNSTCFMNASKIFSSKEDSEKTGGFLVLQLKGNMGDILFLRLADEIRFPGNEDNKEDFTISGIAEEGKISFSPSESGEVLSVFIKEGKREQEQD